MPNIIEKDFPSDTHYAVIVFDSRIGCDGDGWWHGDNAVNYFIMTLDEIATWIGANKDRRYKVIEASPMTVTIPKPIISPAKPYVMPPHLVEMKNKVLDQASEYAETQRERIASIQDPVMKSALIKDLKEGGDGWL
jgi:hypothetical protein